MKVVYTAPNRSHHYIYAEGLNKAGVLKAFVSGFSRYSPRAKLPELRKKLVKADWLQTIYIIALKLKLPDSITARLAYYSKIEQDKACKKYLRGTDIFMFYNGSGLNSCRYAKKMGVITVVEAVNSHVDYQEKLLQAEYQRLNIPFTPFHPKEKARRLKEYEEADYIVLPSEFVKKSFLEYGFPEEKILKVPYGFYNFNTAQNKFVRNTSAFTVLYVGSISVRKGLRYLIQAFQQLQHSEKKLVIVGPQTDPSGIENVDIPDNITFTGPLKGDDLANAYRSADVFVLPSIEEGFALVLGEAMSFGVPVIATTNTGAKDLITEGKEGYIVPVGDAGAICTKLQLLADDMALLQRLKKNCVDAASHLEGWKASTDKLVSLFSGILNKRKNGAQ